MYSPCLYVLRLLRSGRFWQEFGRVFDAISLETSVRAVVLASALPKLFSAGIDCKHTLIRSTRDKYDSMPLYQLPDLTVSAALNRTLLGEP